MTVTKFQTYSEAERALWCFQPDHIYFQNIKELWNLANRLAPPDFPRGVFKYRTLTEANLQKEQWIIARALSKLKKRKQTVPRQKN